MYIKQLSITAALLLTFFAFFYFVETLLPEADTTFLSVSTFLFAIFAGFFTSRQSTRHEDLRERIAQFDGNLTSIYRAAGTLDDDLQHHLGIMIKDHYSKILSSKRWDYHFNRKSETISNVHNILKEKISGKEFDDLGKAVLAQVEWSLRDLQRVRKDQVSIYQERIPLPQWFLLYILAFILVATLTTIPSYLLFYPALLKAAFTTSIVSVLYLLNRLDAFAFFEGVIGESSARDVIAVIEGSR